MAKKSGLAQQLFQGIYDLSGDVSAISSWSTPVGVLDITGINKSANERIQGVVSGNLSYNVFFNDAAGAAHLASRGPPTSTVLTWAMGATVGDVAGMVVGLATSYDGTRAADGMITFDIEQLSNSTPPVWGVMLTPGLKTDTSAANGATLDQGAQTTAGAEAILHVTSFTGERYVRVISAGTFNPVSFALSFRRGAATDRVTYA